MASEWPRVSLGELLTLERRPVKVLPDAQYAEIGTYSFGRGIFHKQPRSGLEVGDKDLYLIRAGDFILQITFAWEGAVALASAAEDGMYGSVRFPTFRVNEVRCYSPFLVNYFKIDEGRRQLVNISPGSAGRNRVLSIKRIPEVSIPLPPLDEQRRIVARIEALARRVEEARGLRREAAGEAEALLKSARVEVFTDQNAEKLGKSLGEIATFLDSKRIPLNAEQRGEKQPGDIPYYGASGIVDYVNEWLFDETLLLVSEDGANIELRSKPIAFVIRGKSWVNNHAHVLRLHSETSAVFLSHYIESLDVRPYWQGATRPKINKSALEAMQVPDVPSIEQQRIVAYLDGLQAKVDELKHLQTETQKELDALMPSILAKAFAGEL